MRNMRNKRSNTFVTNNVGKRGRVGGGGGVFYIFYC